MADRRIEYMPLSELKPDPKNPKSHDLGLLDQSYTRFGVVEPQVIDERTGFLISGHGRNLTLRDAEKRGDEPPEGVQVDPTTGAWLVPVVRGWASKNDAEAAASLISMNRTTEMGGWDDKSLLDLLDAISSSGAGFDGVGYSETDLDDLRHLLEDVPDLDALADEFDPENIPGSGGGKAVAIKLTDPALIDAWHEVRDTVKTDDEAFRVISAAASGTAPAIEGFRVVPSRLDEPTADDLADDETADDSASPAPQESSKPVPAAEVDEPELPDDDDGLDWSTAATVAPGDGTAEDETDDADDELVIPAHELEDEAEPVASGAPASVPAPTPARSDA